MEKEISQVNMNRIGLQQKYFDEYKKIIVTYKDGSKKVFTPDLWFLLENRIRPIAKEIKIIKKFKTNNIMKSISKFMSNYTGTNNKITNLFLFVFTIFAIVCLGSFIVMSIVNGWK